MAELKARERCGSGDYNNAHLKRAHEMDVFPDTFSNYRSSRLQISTEKVHDMNSMYSHFIAGNRWPDFLSSPPHKCHDDGI